MRNPVALKKPGQAGDVLQRKSGMLEGCELRPRLARHHDDERRMIVGLEAFGKIEGQPAVSGDDGDLVARL